MIQSLISGQVLFVSSLVFFTLIGFYFDYLWDAGEENTNGLLLIFDGFYYIFVYIQLNFDFFAFFAIVYLYFLLLGLEINQSPPSSTQGLNLSYLPFAFYVFACSQLLVAFESEQPMVIICLYKFYKIRKINKYKSIELSSLGINNLEIIQQLTKKIIACNVNNFIIYLLNIAQFSRSNTDLIINISFISLKYFQYILYLFWLDIYFIINSYYYQMELSKVNQSKKFKQFSENQKKRMIENAKKKTNRPDGIFVVVSCHPKCKNYADIPEFRFIVNYLDKIQKIDLAIRGKVTNSDKKYANQSVFLFSQSKLLNIDTSILEIYNQLQNFKDGILYLYYADVQSF